MPDKDKTSPEDLEHEASLDQGSQEASPVQKPEGSEVESAPSAEEIEAFRQFQAKCKDQNVDPMELLPEFTRTRQAAKQLEEENRQWREYVQRTQTQQAQQADPVAALEAELANAETEMDFERARKARAALTRAYAKQEARQIVQEQMQQQQLGDYQTRLKDAAVRLKVPERQVNDLLSKMHQHPEALAIGLAYLHDPDSLPEHFDKQRQERDQRRRRAEAFDSLLSGNSGAGRRVPGSAEADVREPLRVPQSLWYALPEKQARARFGDDAIIVPG